MKTFPLLKRKALSRRSSLVIGGFGGGLVILSLFALRAQAIDCKADPSVTLASVIHLTGKLVPVQYFHDHSTAQIEAMRHSWFHTKMMHNPGLTKGLHSLTTGFRIRGLQQGRRGPVCVWADSVNVDFSFVKMDVYITSQYSEGSCPYKVILDHENQHVAINTRTYEKYKALMLQALMSAQDIPTQADPLVVQTLQTGKAIIGQRINRIVMPLYEAFKTEITAENAKIDTLENYKRTQEKCDKW